MKKVIVFVLAILLLIVPITAARAETVYTEGTLHYIVINDSITITECFGRDAEVTVPAMIAGTPVNTIAAGAFTNNHYIETLYLPDTISKVENGAIGDWIRVIYNANTDHPQETPTDLILSNMDPQPTPMPTPTPGGNSGSGSGEIGSNPQPTATPTPTPTATPVPTPSSEPEDEPEVNVDDPAVTTPVSLTAPEQGSDGNTQPTPGPSPTPGAPTPQPAAPTPKPSAPAQGSNNGSTEENQPTVHESEGDVDLTDTEDTEPTPEPTETVTEPEPSTVEPTAAPVNNDEDTRVPGATPEPVVPTENDNATLTWLWILIGVVVVAAVVLAAVLAGRKKK